MMPGGSVMPGLRFVLAGPTVAQLEVFFSLWFLLWHFLVILTCLLMFTCANRIIKQYLSNVFNKYLL